MQTTLVVVRPFGSYAIGDLITTPDTVSQILASDQARCVVRAALPAAAAAAPATKTEG